MRLREMNLAHNKLFVRLSINVKLGRAEWKEAHTVL